MSAVTSMTWKQPVPPSPHSDSPESHRVPQIFVKTGQEILKLTWEETVKSTHDYQKFFLSHPFNIKY